MMIGKVKRLSNPRPKSKKNKPRRKLSAKQIKHFGTKRQRAALKAKRNPRKKNVAAKPRVIYRTRVVKAKATKKRKRSANPLQMVTLGLVNPKRRKSVATKTKKRKATKKSGTKRNGTRRMVVMGKRKTSHSHRRKSSRNPSIAGVSGIKGIGELLVGGIGGITLAKATPAFLPSAVTGNPIITALVTGGIGWLAGSLLTKFNKNIGDGVAIGALITAAGDVINYVAPQFGLGAFIPASFNEPDNPVWAGNQRLLAARQAAMATPAAMTPGMKGVVSAYGGAY